MNQTDVPIEGGHRLSLDLETYSDVDLPKCGVYKYVESENFQILILAYAFDTDPVQVVDMACGESIPDAVLSALEDETIIKCAWNANFERTCLSHYLGHQLKPEGWHCSMVLALSLGLPASLKNAGAVLHTDIQKDKRGEALIRYFSLPCKPTKKNGGRTRNLPADDPEGWSVFKEYCKTDVATERSIRTILDQYPMPQSEWNAYCVDQRINDRGVLLDKGLITNAIICDGMLSEGMMKRAYELTGLQNPNSVSQLKKWMEERGIPIDSLGKKDVEKMITDLDQNGSDQEVLDMLKLRLLMSKSSVKKYMAAERVMCSDGRARGLFAFYGASHTGRFSSRYLQLQNLKRNDITTLDEARDLLKMGQYGMIESIYGNTPEILSQLVRTMLIPKEGYEFIVADFNAIEARVLAWEAGEQWSLDAFQKGEDLYCATASAMFHKPVVKHGINGELRSKGKIATLACGYQGSVGALKAMGALSMGIKESELPDIIEQWRTANPHIVQYWYDMETAAKDTIENHRKNTVRMITFEYYGGTMWMVLPSGRRISYLVPKITANDSGRLGISYEGITTGNHWGRIDLYGGLITENATQAIARDILVAAMKRFDQMGINIVAHIHDEVILEVPKGKYTVDQMTEIMCRKEEWYQDLPLAAAGYKGNYYYKD